jgi:transcription elongation factor GreA-like protein
MKKIKIIVLYTFILMILSSCIGFRKVKFDEKNPASYTFHIQSTKIIDIILHDFKIDRLKSVEDFMKVQDISIKSWNIYTISEYNKFKASEKIFINEGNKSDLIIVSEPNPVVSYSKIYKKFWKSLEYVAKFQLHFVSLSETETKIEIITLDPKVLYWSLNLFNSGHSYVNFKAVEPTTIEEYEILLRIGNLINEKNMPSLKVP